MGHLLYLFRCTVVALTLNVVGSTQVLLLQIQVVEGEGTVHPPGTRAARPVTVSITDDAGRPVPGAAVSFHLPENGSGGTFANGLRTDVAITDGHGRASIRSFQANRVPGRFQIRIVASKEQSRAGTVSFQYIGEVTGRAAQPHPTRKWVLVAAAAAGGVLAAAIGSRGDSPAVATTPAPVAAPPVALSFGTPTISVGKP